MGEAAFRRADFDRPDQGAVDLISRRVLAAIPFNSMKLVAPSLRVGERSKISAICESRTDSPV